MEKQALKRIFDFLEEKGEHRAPFLWKFKNNEPLIEEDLNVEGNLDLSNSNITLLPEGLKVGGTLDLIQLNIETLPEGLKVGNKLLLAFSSIQTLPKGLEVGGDLYIYGTPLTKYSGEELREMIKPGFIKYDIVR
jgi:hypothetical protein